MTTKIEREDYSDCDTDDGYGSARMLGEALIVLILACAIAGGLTWLYLAG